MRALAYAAALAALASTAWADRGVPPSGSARVERAAPPLPETPFRAVHPSRRTPPFLDATPACLPRGVEGALEVAVRLRDGDGVGLRRALTGLERRASAAADLRALRAIVGARNAASAERERARAELARVAAIDERPEVRACTLIERSRLSLLLERPFDARVDRARAQRAGAESWPPERVLASTWLAAEERHREGDDETARRLWDEIVHATDARLALAARLRLVESDFPVGAEASGDAARAWKEFPALLKSAADARLDVEPWSLVAGELALRAGDLLAAHYWLARAELAWRGGLASLRKADVLAALGRSADARNTLERVLRAAHDLDVRDLAALRLAQLELHAERVPLALERARRPVRSLNPFIRGEALLLVARAQLASGRAHAALESYVRFAHLGGEAHRDESFRAGFERTLSAVTAPGASCAAIVQQLGSRAPLIERHAADAAPLLRVGDCFLQLQLPRAALDTYRIAQRRLGADPRAALAVRIATAALATGDLDAVRAAVEESASGANDDAAALDPVVALRWRWLALALAEREGHSRDGLATLGELARARELPSDLRGEVERALLARLGRSGEREAARASLEASIALAPDLAGEVRGATWLQLADVALASGDASGARSAYARAAELLEPGALRDRALHHGALLVGTKQERRDALAVAASAAPGSGWSRVAGLELRLQRLAEQVDGEQARLP
jgi:tetratricopeptide (TPR) repeat protein